MARRLRHPGPVFSLSIAIAASAALIAAPAGCTRTVAEHGFHGTRATWSPPVLSANLPEPVRATDVAAASDVVLRRLGYTITERHASDDRSTVVGLAPGGSRLDRIVVKAEPDVRETRIEIITRARPDEDRARVALDEILVVLGL
ncbi:MAG: hypothetical protein AAGF47_10300 [Planctomycetota bacterium]